MIKNLPINPHHNHRSFKWKIESQTQGRHSRPDRSRISFLQGPIDIEGDKGNVALIKDTDHKGNAIVGVFKRVGVLYENADANDTNRQPHYSGPLDGGLRISGWRETKGDMRYLSLKVSHAQPKAEAPSQSAQVVQDDVNADAIPF